MKRQVVCFSFYKVMPEWRRLPAEEKAAHKAAFAEVLTKWNKPGEFLSLTYSTIGTRGDVDMCVWSIGYAVDELNKMRSELMAHAARRLPQHAAQLPGDDQALAVSRSTARTRARAKAAARFVPAARSTSSSTRSGRRGPGTCCRLPSASA